MTHYESRTAIGDRNVLVQHARDTIWLEVEIPGEYVGLTCLALQPQEAIQLGMALIEHGHSVNTIATMEAALQDS